MVTERLGRVQGQADPLQRPGIALQGEVEKGASVRPADVVAERHRNPDLAAGRGDGELVWSTDRGGGDEGGTRPLAAQGGRVRHRALAAAAVRDAGRVGVHGGT